MRWGPMRSAWFKNGIGINKKNASIGCHHILPLCRTSASPTFNKFAESHFPSNLHYTQTRRSGFCWRIIHLCPASFFPWLAVRTSYIQINSQSLAVRLQGAYNFSPSLILFNRTEQQIVAKVSLVKRPLCSGAFEKNMKFLSFSFAFFLRPTSRMLPVNHRRN